MRVGHHVPDADVVVAQEFAQLTGNTRTFVVDVFVALDSQDVCRETAAHAGQFIAHNFSDPALRNALQNGVFDANTLLYRTLHLAGGITILAPDKTIDYHETPASAKYAFTFWAFPRSQWLSTMRDYLDWERLK